MGQAQCWPPGKFIRCTAQALGIRPELVLLPAWTEGLQVGRQAARNGVACKAAPGILEVWGAWETSPGQCGSTARACWKSEAPEGQEGTPCHGQRKS